MVGSENRVDLIARDLVEHFENRLEAMDGKAMVVCMSRRICVALYQADCRRCVPNGTTTPMIRVIHQSSDDGLGVRPHSSGNSTFATKSPPRGVGEAIPSIRSDLFKIAIVRDMWLTGFDAPCMHTMYVDKPMRGHGLMQAIARVNRVFHDKPAGLVVDYLGLADELKQALATYTESSGTGRTTVDQAEAVALMQEKYSSAAVISMDLTGRSLTTGKAQDRLSVLLRRRKEHILAQGHGKRSPTGCRHQSCRRRLRWQCRTKLLRHSGRCGISSRPCAQCWLRTRTDEQ